MVNAILKCRKCSKYTMKQSCPDCGSEAVNIVPAKFSPEDKYGEYRRKHKYEELKKKGLI
tara:strand:+ start:1612 stop:1791 length:180 start_codon:yes stop_codon:yes gene_type:complete